MSHSVAAPPQIRSSRLKGSLSMNLQDEPNVLPMRVTHCADYCLQASRHGAASDCRVSTQHIGSLPSLLRNILIFLDRSRGGRFQLHIMSLHLGAC